jgi:ABC-type phosphate/phosphonate transport system permease subunit
MEDYAYNYSLASFCIDERVKPKVAMSELFDMVSGTSTGSLLTTAVVLPVDPVNNRSNKYYANDASDIYKKHGGDVFQTFEIPLWVQILGTIGCVIFGGLLGFFIGMCIFHNKDHEETMKSFHDYIRSRKTLKDKQA